MFALKEMGHASTTLKGVACLLLKRLRACSTDVAFKGFQVHLQSSTDAHHGLNPIFLYIVHCIQHRGKVYIVLLCTENHAVSVE